MRRGERSTSVDDVFEKFVRSHFVLIYRHCQRVYPEVDTDSVVSNTFAVAWRRFEEMPADRATLWLKTIARNSALNERRGQTRWRALRTRVARLETSRDEGSLAPDDDRSLDVGLAGIALRRLSAQDQAILRLQVCEEPSSEQLAAILSVRIGAARTRLSRARRRFREAFEEERRRADER